MTARWGLALCVASLVVSACGDTTAPANSLLGTWEMVGFSENGIAAVTTGIAEFRSDGTFAIAGTVTFPGGPTDSVGVDGTYRQTGAQMEMTVGTQTGTWNLTFAGNQVVLTLVEPPPPNTITLRRR